MFNLGMPELLLILVIALVVFGPGKLPEMGKALGNAIREFRSATAGEAPARLPDGSADTENRSEVNK